LTAPHLLFYPNLPFGYTLAATPPGSKDQTAFQCYDFFQSSQVGKAITVPNGFGQGGHIRVGCGRKEVSG